MPEYTPEERQRIHKEAMRKLDNTVIREAFPVVEQPGGVLIIHHVCGHIIKYERDALEDIYNQTLGEVTGQKCSYCVVKESGITLEGCWKK